MSRQYKVTLLTILLCLVAIEVPADSWDEGNYKPYNTDVVLEKTNLPILFKERWTEIRNSTLGDKHVTEMIDSLVNEVTIGGACERNYQAWPIWDKEYDLQGHKFTNKPTDRGTYIHQGNKEVIK